MSRRKRPVTAEEQERRRARVAKSAETNGHMHEPWTPADAIAEQVGVDRETVLRIAEAMDSEAAAQDLGLPEIDLEDEDAAPLRVRKPDLSKARPPRFIWEDRLLAGYFNLLLGEEGVGKGVLAAYLIAQLTQGTLPGAAEGAPIGVGIMSDEDSFEDVWGPRLHVAGADLDYVSQIDRPDGGFVHLAHDVRRLGAIAQEHGIELFFFDQLLDHMGGDVDTFNQQKVRKALQPVRAMARRLNVGILGVLHPNKQGKSFRQLVYGSGFNQLARSALWIAKDPDDAEMRVVVRPKGNLSIEPPAVTFRIESATVDLNGESWSVPRAYGFEHALTSVEEIIESFSQGTTGADYSKVGAAKEAIAEALPRDGEWHMAGDIIAATEVDKKTAQRARKALGIETRKAPDTFPARTQWRWPTKGGER